MFRYLAAFLIESAELVYATEKHTIDQLLPSCTMASGSASNFLFYSILFYSIDKSVATTSEKWKALDVLDNRLLTPYSAMSSLSAKA